MSPRLLLPSALRFIDPSTRSRGPDVPQHPSPAPPSFRRPSSPAASVDWLCSGLFRFLIRLWSVRTARVHRTYMTPSPHPSDSRVLRVGVWFHHRVVPAQVGAHRRLVWVPLRLTILALNVSSKKDQLFKSCCVCSPLSRTPPRQHPQTIKTSEPCPVLLSAVTPTVIKTGNQSLQPPASVSQ